MAWNQNSLLVKHDNTEAVQPQVKTAGKKIDFKARIKSIVASGKIVKRVSSFVVLLMLYMLRKLVIGVGRSKVFPQKVAQKMGPNLGKINDRMLAIFDTHDKDSISRMHLIDLSIKNMKSKKTRTIITIGGMTIGIGAIVFLVSIGYGVQNLVITRVARLDEMRQADVSPQPGGKVKINDKTVADFKELAGVENALPMIAVVGRINYQNSVSDMAVYGVTSDYLNASAVKPIEGKIFENNELVFNMDIQKNVFGASQEAELFRYGQKIREVEFQIEPEQWVRVREKPSTKSGIVGYTKRGEGMIQAEELAGEKYENESSFELTDFETKEPLGRWIKAEVPIWEKTGCTECENGYEVLRDDTGSQIVQKGYFAEVGVTIREVSVAEESGAVLALMTEDGEIASAESVMSDSEWIALASEAGIMKPAEVKMVPLGEQAVKQAVVNRAMLKVLGIKENEAIGKSFDASFVIVGSLLEDGGEKVESVPAAYTVVGVTPDEKTPVFYVPFVDLRSLGVTNFSQIKLVANRKEDLPKLRKQVESLGYGSRSVADTVSQINSLFATARTVLALLGMVALAVASLGMFNTLTVSLLERTREVGLMKAMGMKSSEVQELFLTESMIMGFFGGVVGIGLGFGLGKLLGLIISMFTMFKGAGYVDITSLPGIFVIIIVILSLVVGILTGIYPARRATQISALNAMRYE